MFGQLYGCLHTHQTYDPTKAFGGPMTTPMRQLDSLARSEV
jgi:hypothetical protein